jgi:hypothetical protein
MTMSRCDVPAMVRFGRFLQDRQRHELLADGVPVRIGSRALDVLIVRGKRRTRRQGRADEPRVAKDGGRGEYPVVPNLDVAQGAGALIVTSSKPFPAEAIVLLQTSRRIPTQALPRSRNTAVHRLPQPPALTSEHIGRQAILAELADFVAAHRFPTLTGGGTDKTLGMALRRPLSVEFTDGARITALGPLLDPGLVLPAVASVLGLAEVDPTAPERLTAVLGSKALLFALSIGPQMPH